MGESSYIRPGHVARQANRLLGPLAVRLGAATALVVPGRKTGKAQVVPVNILRLDGERYLVSARGESQWVQNLRATGRGELRGRGTIEPFAAEEVPDEQKPRIIAAYRERWDWQVKSYFQALPDPADHPIFRLLPPG